MSKNSCASSISDEEMLELDGVTLVTVEVVEVVVLVGVLVGVLEETVSPQATSNILPSKTDIKPNFFDIN
jgi:hypothetical protein